MKSFSFLNYPVAISNALVGITKILDKYCSSIILYGSTAINKLVYQTNSNGSIHLFSDIEFLVIPNNEEDAYNKSFKKKMHDLIYAYLDETNDLYVPYVDVYPVSIDFFSKAQSRICSFELKNNAIVIKGGNLLTLLPEITIETYDYKAQNIEIVKGLKILLIESHRFFVVTDSNENQESKRFCYFLSSSLLNILRTLLPLFGHFLLTTEERVAAIDTLRTDERILNYFSDDILDAFKTTLIQKTQCTYHDSAEKLLCITIRAYRSTLCLLLGASNSSLLAALDHCGETLFSGPLWKRKQLALLTSFFVGALEGLQQLIHSGEVSDSTMHDIRSCFDNMIGGKNAYDYFNIISHYTELEKYRWRIIGSKD